MKYIWKRCDAGGSGYAQMAFTKPAGAADWRVSSKWYAPPAPPLKRGLSGLVVIDPTKIPVYAGDGADAINVDATIKVNWSQLETADGVFNLQPITDVLDAYPTSSFRVRIMAGTQSPAYLTSGGQCVPIQPDSPNGAAGCVPHFWESGSVYRQRYQRLMRKLALELVANQDYQSHVIDIVSSACTTIYAEPFILGATNASKHDLWQAGYTFAGHKDCLTWSTEMMTAMFPTTKISIDGHDKWQSVDASGQPTYSWPQERDYLDGELLPTYAPQLVLEDHGLDVDSGGSAGTLCASGVAASHDWYCYLAHLPQTHPDTTYGFQFTLNGTYQQMEDAAELGADAGACYLETKDFGGMSAPQRRTYHQRLLANCPSD